MDGRILVTGANGQIGSELVGELSRRYGADAVIASDIAACGRDAAVAYRRLDVLDADAFESLVRSESVGQVYHLAAQLSATAEHNPLPAWRLNMDGLLNVLEVARRLRLGRVFWPSSIAVFGADAPRAAAPQDAPTNPDTVYGISKVAGEKWCQYYRQQHGVDVRSLRYPGIISYLAPPGGGTTDYAVDMFRAARSSGRYTCYLRPDTALPMMYMPDALRATLELMQAPAASMGVRGAYNLAAFSFTPRELAEAIRRHLPSFQLHSAPDERQAIADGWPASIDDGPARADWGWRPGFDLPAMVADMLAHCDPGRRDGQAA